MDRYINTKFLVVTTSGDEFFLPSDTGNFWKDLYQVTDGSALFKRLPNAEHTMAGHEIGLFQSITSFYMSVYDV